MRAGVERFARRVWGGRLGWPGVVFSGLAAPASWAWSAVVLGRDGWFASRPGTRIEGLRVVSVGNLAVGGTGKTPMSAWIAARLHASGVPCGVLVGGHGEDEALLHESWNPGVRVLSGRDRAAGAARARTEGACVAVLDDGFQHRTLDRDVDLVLLSAEDPFPGPVLPRGPYREGPRALGRADAVVVTRRSAPLDAARALAASAAHYAPGAVHGAIRIQPGRWRRLDGGGRPPGACDVLAVCGIARPYTFRAAVEAYVEGAVELITFADHHAYGRADAARLRSRAGERPIVVTEKDAVKLTRYSGLLGETYVLGEELRWDWGEEDVAGLLDTLVGEVVGR